jgi:hypothetical protein
MAIRRLNMQRSQGQSVKFRANIAKRNCPNRGSRLVEPRRAVDDEDSRRCLPPASQQPGQAESRQRVGRGERPSKAFADSHGLQNAQDSVERRPGPRESDGFQTTMKGFVSGFASH